MFCLLCYIQSRASNGCFLDAERPNFLTRTTPLKLDRIISLLYSLAQECIFSIHFLLKGLGNPRFLAQAKTAEMTMCYISVNDVDTEILVEANIKRARRNHNKIRVSQLT
jgi:hypothetical protein